MKRFVWVTGYMVDIGSPRGLRRFSRIGASVAFVGHLERPGAFLTVGDRPAMHFSGNKICRVYRTDNYLPEKHRSILATAGFISSLIKESTMPLQDSRPAREMVDDLGPQHPVGSR